MLNSSKRLQETKPQLEPDAHADKLKGIGLGEKGKRVEVRKWDRGLKIATFNTLVPVGYSASGTIAGTIARSGYCDGYSDTVTIAVTIAKRVPNVVLVITSSF
ncbi:hypothetical protein L6452_09857 [Arctium lappa]|uniref:Uncharacterized protein n=1 Tax=Arctium lappa TaxID=4217 RepID=A0ACB9DMG7_ARCLA|nr:hypothetical protein L6452_09857 [Arctium lappa]